MVKPRRNNRRPHSLKSDSSSYSTHHEEEEEEEERKPQPLCQAAETGASIVHPRQAQRQSGQTTEEAVALQNKGCAAQLGTGLGIRGLGLIPRLIADWCGAFSDYTTKIAIPSCLLFLRWQFLDAIGPGITFSLSTKWR